MTVLTGETGAGKSILLTAMKLCLGERADTTLLRPGAEKAEISLDFDISQIDSVKHWLEQHEIDDEECIIRRVVNADGRSRAFINGQAVNLKTLEDLSTHLIGIHGQHAHLTLLQPSKQCALVDDSCQPKSELLNCQNAYEHWKTLNDELVKLAGGNVDNEGEKQLLRYQIQELEEADLVNFDYAKLIEEHTRLSNMGKIVEVGERQANQLYEDDAQSIYTQLSDVSQHVTTLADMAPEFSEVSEQLTEAVIQIQEAGRDLRSKLDNQNADPEQQQAMDQRLSLVHKLARKLHVEPNQIKEKYRSLESRLNQLEHRDERLSALQQEIKTSEHNYYSAALLLHQRRSDKAEELGGHISSTLKTLGLPDGKLEIQCHYDEQSKPLLNGLDQVQLMISTNPGMPLMPMGKVASGGELSRISLAIQVVATQAKTTPTLIFDEVDAGIGGGVAETVGVRLRELAADRQILCVTHLPQVASQGQQHIFVSKSKEQGAMQTEVKLLDNEQRVREVARMLGGTEMSEKTIAHAQEMVENANTA